ncbi:MAG: hypothetical protein GX490_05895 [Bacilli bacterium]|nr:hypothetical protein [Bacilli bacterium]
MKRKTILIAHNNLKLIQKMQEYCRQRDLYSIIDYVLDGEELVKMHDLNDYDIVIVKDALTNIPGIYALETILFNTKKRPELIVLLTPFTTEFIQSKCDQLGLIHVNELEIGIEELYNIINHLEIKAMLDNQSFFDSQRAVINLLKKIGLLKVYIGYTYFEYILNVMLESSENLYKRMHTIYKMIGEHFNVTPASVEKAMRTCIRSSLSKSDGFYAQMLFGNYHDSYPSNSIFLQVCINTLKEQKSYIVNKQIQKSLRKI